MPMMRRFRILIDDYKILRGVLSYATLWPIGNLIEQTLVEKRNFKTYDWHKCCRVSMYGAVVMGPSMFAWLRFVSQLYPGRTVTSSVGKALCEQLAYDPLNISFFLFSMTLVEGKNRHAAVQEVKDKFMGTYSVGVVYWPVVQTLNFVFIPVCNQVVCTSFFSMLWSAFLAYRKHLEMAEDEWNADQLAVELDLS